MRVEKGLMYSKEHEWVRVEGNTAYIGITDYAQESLGSIVFVELPKEGTDVRAGEVLSVVESVKAASDIYSPVSGTVKKVNEKLGDKPEEINSNPYESWIAALEMSDMSQLDELMEADEYEIYTKGG